MVEIVLSEDDNIHWAIKAFKRKVQRSGLYADMRRKRFYLKPSAVRQMKRAAARNQRRKMARRAAR